MSGTTGVIAKGSAKDLIEIVEENDTQHLGLGKYNSKNTISIGDLKELMPEHNIVIEGVGKGKHLLTQAKLYFDYQKSLYPEIETTFQGVLDENGALAPDIHSLVKRGFLPSQFLMELAHTPASYTKDISDMDDDARLEKFLDDVEKWTLDVAVANVEVIYRFGLPLGSSFFEKVASLMTKATGKNFSEQYSKAATFSDVAQIVEDMNSLLYKTADTKPVLDFLKSFKLEDPSRIPMPGERLLEPDMNYTTKFNKGGDRPFKDEQELRRSLMLSEQGYVRWLWISEKIEQSISSFGQQKNVYIWDTKGELVNVHGRPRPTDFWVSMDESRPSILISYEGNDYWVHAGKELVRAVFKERGVYHAIFLAKQKAETAGDPAKWKTYVKEIIKEKDIDLQAVITDSVELLSGVIPVLTNRFLGYKNFSEDKFEKNLGELVKYGMPVKK